LTCYGSNSPEVVVAQALLLDYDLPMRKESVEIYSDQTNAAVMKHPGRRFPGVLVQGDSLFSLCCDADEACEIIGRGAPGYEETNDLRNRLWGYLAHYKSVLMEHGLPLPFSEQQKP
jgi:hypothetical protein